MNEWVRKRLEGRKARIQSERDAQTLQINARNSANAMIQNLQGTVWNYVEDYNRSFPEDCKAVATTESDGGFNVVCGQKVLRVLKNEGTLVNYELTSKDNPGVPAYRYFEIAPDPQSRHIRYKSGDKFLEVEQATELMLDQILCD